MTPKSKPSESTAKATKSAVKAAEPVRHDGPLPTNGERDGVFYFQKVISGSAEVPAQTHADNHHEVIRMAEATGWLPDGGVYEAEQRNLDDRWEVVYAVTVRPNGTDEG